MSAPKFLNILAPGEPVTFQTFSDKDELKVKRPGGTVYDPNAHIFHGTLEELKQRLAELVRKGAGVFVMVNEGDGRGRAAKNVLRVRALFIDTDGAPYPTDLSLKPHLVVESSPGRWHLYWRVNGVELVEFAVFQTALAEHYGTDPSVKDLPRVMRLPGSLHHKGAPFKVRLQEANEHAPFSRAELFSAWPFLAERLEQIERAELEKEARRAASSARNEQRQKNPPQNGQSRAKALLQAHHDRIAAAPEGTRHDTLLRSARALGGYVASGVLERAEVEDALLGAAAVCGLSETEAESIIAWGMEKGASEPLDLDNGFLRPAYIVSRRKRFEEWFL